MSTVISAGTTTNTAYNVNPDTSGTMVLATGSGPTTAVNIDSSQNVAIGNTTTTGYRLTVDNGAQTTGQYSSIWVKGGSVSANGGQIALTNTYSGVSNPNKYLRVDNNGALSVVNSAYNTGIFTLTDTGGLTVGGRGISSSSMPAGTVLQVLQTVLTSVTSIGATSPTAISGLSVAITPTSSTSKILVSISVTWGTQGDTYGGLIYRNGSAISGALGNTNGSEQSVTFALANQQYDGNQAFSTTFQYLDSPATTSSTTYQLYAQADNTNPLYINRSYSDPNSITGKRCISTITVMEIAQ